MASFKFFFEQVTKWLNENHHLVFVETLGTLAASQSEENPSSNLLWKSYLVEILPERFVSLFKENYFFGQDLLNKLLSLNHYGIERKATALIEQSNLRFLPSNDQKLLVDKLVIFFNQLDNWIDGSWHSQIKTDRFSCLEKIAEDLKFPNKWSAASFLTRCGYLYPNSKNAYSSWIKWGGAPSREDEYNEWLDCLQQINPEFESIIVADSMLDHVFSPKPDSAWPSLCIRLSDCLNCPIQKKCSFYDHTLQHDFRAQMENQIRLGNLREIDSEALIRYLAGEKWQNTSVQKKLVSQFPNISSITSADFRKDSMEEKLYLFLHGMIDLSNRLQQTKTLAPGITFTSSSDIFEYVKSEVGDSRQELFYTLILDNKHRVIRLEDISKGTLNQSLVHPREVFAPAIQVRAAALVLIHNHPSGDPKPSNQDKQITKRLQEVGKLVGIQVLDHLIIGSNSYFSFVDENLIS